MSFSLTYGKKAVFKRNVFQGVCCKASTKLEADKIVQFIKN